ncbi:lysophospholipid acyltransferase family protein [Thermodesulfobacteriota bacterium]
MIRYFFLNAFIGVFSAIFCIWGLMVALFDRTGKKVHKVTAVPWARGILKVCGVKVIVTGLENVNSNMPRVYMNNHQSFFDIFALLACLPVDFKFILKQELMRIPLLGPAMKRARYISIDRENPRKAVKSMDEAAERIRNGASVVIFPEGTRSPDGHLLPLKKGGFVLALKSGCDIVPITIDGSHRIAPKGSLRINKGSFNLHIGQPIPVSGYSKKNIDELMEKVRFAIQEPMKGKGQVPQS